MKGRTLGNLCLMFGYVVVYVCVRNDFVDLTEERVYVREELYCAFANDSVWSASGDPVQLQWPNNLKCND